MSESNHQDDSTLDPAPSPDEQSTLRGEATELQYQLVRKLGEGSYGEVWMARHEDLQRDVALKILKGDESETSEAARRFLREGRTLASLDHPGFCRVYDKTTQDGRPTLVFEYIDGPTLEKRLDDGLEINTAIDIVVKLARTLQLAHDQDIVHRDLKPANIMFRDQQQPVVMDFGLCTNCGCDGDPTLTAAGTLLGTPSYMSPEQANGETESVGPASDQWRWA